MLKVVALRAKHFTICRVVPKLGELRERLDMVNMQSDFYPAAFTDFVLNDAALLALLAGPLKRQLTPLSCFPIVPCDPIDFAQATAPVRVLLAVSSARDQRFSDVAHMFFGEDPPRL